MKKQQIKRTAIHLVGALMFLIIVEKASAQTTNFTGTWKLNAAKIKAPGVDPNSIAQVLKITADSRSVTIIKLNQSNQDEKTGYAETLKFDGSPTETITPSKLNRTSTLKWSADQKSFTETFSSKDDQGTIKQNGTITFSLISTNELKIIAKQSYGERSFDLEETYDKQ